MIDYWRQDRFAWIKIINQALNCLIRIVFQYDYFFQASVFENRTFAPGMEMRLKAMNHFTAKLPLVEADSNVPLIGYDTKSNMLSGAVLGMAYEIDGFIDEYAKKFDNFNVLLTGGDIVHLASHLKNKIFADPDLIFKGLYAISEVNNL